MRTLSKFLPLLPAAFLAGALLLPAGPAWAADPAPAPAPAPAPQKPTDAKICLNCHKAAPGNLHGTFENVAMKSETIQIKIDAATEVLKFDQDEIKVLNTTPKQPVADALRSIKKGHEVRVEYTEKGGVKFASLISAKPPIKVPAEKLLKTADIEKLIAQGPEKGKYLLVDSRPAPRFQEGYIPTAINIPFPAFNKMTDKLPQDKNQLLIFYCNGFT
jgi:hypothetical protein